MVPFPKKVSIGLDRPAHFLNLVIARSASHYCDDKGVIRRAGEFSVMAPGLRELLHATSGHRTDLLVYYCSAERNELNRQEANSRDAGNNYGRVSASCQTQNPENQGKDLRYCTPAGKVLQLTIYD